MVMMKVVLWMKILLIFGKEDLWMKARTSFPYELIERSKDLTLGAPIGTNVYLIGRSGERKNRCLKTETVDILKFLKKFF